MIRRGAVIAGLAAGTLFLSSCGAFFQCEGKADCGTSTTGTTTGTNSGDYAYVSNSASGSSYLNEYDVSSGALTPITGTPANLDYTPDAMAVAPGNSYMYIGNSAGDIYEYTIGTTGALTIANGGQAVTTLPTGFTSMDVSPDGNWLFALDNAGLILYEFPITVSSGLLGSYVGFSISTGGSVTPQAVKVSPNENFVACALGLAGTIVFPYTSASGIGTNAYASLTTGSSAVGDFAVAMDTNNYLYLARTTGPAVYQLSSPGTNQVSATSITQSSLTNGNGPHSIALSTSAGSAVYVGNATDGTISAYSQSAGVLTNVVSAGYTAPTEVLAMQRDKSGKYLISAGYNGTSGIQVYTIGSNGALVTSATAGSGTSLGIPALIAVTH